jgi:hypothetical protein
MSRIEQSQLRDLQGFELSENTAADLLEKTIGIAFTQKPQKIELNFKNRIRRAKDQGIGGFISGAVKRDRMAFYSRQYGAVFVPEDDLFTELHENVHALVDSINPQIRDAIEELPIMVSQRVIGNPVNLDHVEKIVVYRCFDEGMAHWGALKTVEQHIEDFDQADVTSVKNVLAGGTDKNHAADVVLNKLRLVRSAISAYKAVLSQTGPRVMMEGFKAESQISDSKDSIGYYFVNEAMKALVDKGNTAGVALTRLIKDPPKSVDDLEKPQEYVTRENFQ